MSETPTYDTQPKFSMFRLRFRCLALALAFGSATAVFAAEGLDKGTPKGPSAITAVDQALERPISLHFDKQPLDQVVRELDRRLPVEVKLNLAALRDIRCECEIPVTIDVKNISLAAALVIMLQPLELSWREQNDTLIITSREDSQDNVETRYYDVTTLIHDPVNADYGALSDLIEIFVVPQSWPAGTGSGPIRFVAVRDMQLLAVPQTDVNHREVRLFLDALRQAKHGNSDDKKTAFQPPKQIQHSDHAVCLALDRKIHLEIPDFAKDGADCVRPLAEVLRRLAKSADVNIVIDEAALGHGDMKRKTLIYIRPMQGTLRECLNRICRAPQATEGTLQMDLASSSPASLRWTVSNEVVWITTREEEEFLTTTRIYDVWDMPPTPTRPVVTKPAVTKGGVWRMDNRLPYRREKLTATVAKIITPERWNDGSCQLLRYEGPGISALVVEQRWGVHQQIESFLAALREARCKDAAEANCGR